MSRRTYNIEVRFLGGLTATQQATFQLAADRWSQIITSDVPRVEINGEVIDDVRIDTVGSRIDGPGGILAQAGPRLLRPDTLLPALGFMEFDRTDLARMESDGSLENVIIHEMGHALGIGSIIWKLLGLLEGAGTTNPVFTGRNAMREFAALIGADAPTPVPVENSGDPSTHNGHWEEGVFGNELMTGFLEPGLDPISRVTIAALQDIGYQVNLDAANAFTLPGFLELAVMGISAVKHPWGCLTAGYQRREAEPTVLPEGALE